MNRKHGTFYLRKAAFSLLALTLCLASACSSLNDPNVPEPIHRLLEPEHETEYLLYRPSAYDRSHGWPLVVVCHGRFPDSAVRQMRDWTQLAERHGFLVAVPTFTTKYNPLTPDAAADKFEGSRAARNRILALVQHVRAGHSLSRDRVFIYGRGNGAGLALYAGLSAPDVFRAIAVSDPKFEVDFLHSLEGRIDPYQPVLVQRPSSGILTGKQADRCIVWLRAQSLADLQTEIMPSDRIVTAERAVTFFEAVVRTKPWLRIRIVPADDNDPMAVAFRLTGTHQPRRFHWTFGDGGSSSVAEPIHRYAEPGVYRVRVTVDGPHDTELTRFLDVSVPRTPIKPIGTEP